MFTQSECNSIEREHGSPFYAFDADAFRANFRDFRAALDRRYPRVLFGYSYKTNYTPYVCRLVREMGGVAEVVSRLEYDLAERIGHPPREIIFNGPLKRRDDLERAFRGGATVHLDAPYELDALLAFVAEHPHVKPRIGLRVNIDLADATGASHTQMGYRTGRFGFAPDAIAEAAAKLRQANVPVRVLHGHCSSSTRQTWIYQRIAQVLCDLAAEHFAESVEDINVGGGFFGKLKPGFGPPDAPSFDDYAEAIVSVLRSHPWAAHREPRLVLEPGVALVADTFSYFTRIVGVKSVRGSRIVIADGNVFHTKPSMHAKPQPYAVLRAHPDASDGDGVTQITGSTCMEKDYLLQDVPGGIDRGDYVRIDNVGAYTIVMSPTFIHPAPAIVTREGSDLRVLRRRQTFDHAFAQFEF
jgi:diaminopimelate decarboxylase